MQTYKQLLEQIKLKNYQNSNKYSIFESIPNNILESVLKKIQKQNIKHEFFDKSNDLFEFLQNDLVDGGTKSDITNDSLYLKIFDPITGSGIFKLRVSSHKPKKSEIDDINGKKSFPCYTYDLYPMADPNSKWFQKRSNIRHEHLVNPKFKYRYYCPFDDISGNIQGGELIIKIWDLMMCKLLEDLCNEKITNCDIMFIWDIEEDD